MSKVVAVIFAGGSGVRMHAEKPKQFLEVDGKPIIIHTLDIFEEHPAVDEIYIACKSDYIEKLEKIVKRFDIKKIKKIVPGGSTGMDSIYNGLKAAGENNNGDAIVLIHDGVRPCVGEGLINEVIEKVKETGAVATCTPMFETPVISKSGKLVEETPKRADCFTAQAPQSFMLGEIIKAHEAERKENPNYEGLVDSCSLMKKYGKDVYIIKGPRSNIKVTTPEDLYIFKAMLEYKNTQDTFGIE